MAPRAYSLKPPGRRSSRKPTTIAASITGMVRTGVEPTVDEFTRREDEGHDREDADEDQARADRLADALLGVDGESAPTVPGQAAGQARQQEEGGRGAGR